MMFRSTPTLHLLLRRFQFRLHRRSLRLIRQWETGSVTQRRYHVIAVTLMLLAIFLPSLVDGIRGLSEVGTNKPAHLSRLTAPHRVLFPPMAEKGKAQRPAVAPGDTNHRGRGATRLAPQPSTH